MNKNEHKPIFIHILTLTQSYQKLSAPESSLSHTNPIELKSAFHPFSLSLISEEECVGWISLIIQTSIPLLAIYSIDLKLLRLIKCSNLRDNSLLTLKGPL